jgi:RNA polymerase sigma factor (sigma-70 family)
VAVAVPVSPSAPAAPVGSTAAAGVPERSSDETVRVLLDNHDRFLAFVERRVGSRDDAEDILQEAFVRSLDRASSIRDSASATAWFYRVLRNALTDYYRRQDSRGRAISRLASEADPADEPDAELEAVVCACIVSLVETIKPEYGAAIRRVDLDGISVREYAEEAGITPSNAGVRLHRARETLRKQVAKTCGTCVEHGCMDCACRTGQP